MILQWSYETKKNNNNSLFQKFRHTLKQDYIIHRRNIWNTFKINIPNVIKRHIGEIS